MSIINVRPLVGGGLIFRNRFEKTEPFSKIFSKISTVSNFRSKIVAMVSNSQTLTSESFRNSDGAS